MGEDSVMAQEIERKFLVTGDTWRRGIDGICIRQGYLSSVKERTVRVRTAGTKGFLTVKGLTTGVTRAEFEYEIPFNDASAMLDTLAERPLVEKTRYRILVGKLVWEVDEFHGENEGLIVAEVELSSADTTFEKPCWIGQEVSDDPRYFNSMLALHPYGTWKKN